MSLPMIDLSRVVQETGTTYRDGVHASYMTPLPAQGKWIFKHTGQCPTVPWLRGYLTERIRERGWITSTEAFRSIDVSSLCEECQRNIHSVLRKVIR